MPPPAPLRLTLLPFVATDPNEQQFLKESHHIGATTNEWTHAPILVALKRKAKKAGLWNMFLPVDSAALAGEHAQLAGGLTNRQYAEVCEILGTSSPMEFAAQATNCTSPDSGNMEVLARYGTPAQRAKWLVPLLQGANGSGLIWIADLPALPCGSLFSARCESESECDGCFLVGSALLCADCCL